MRWGQRGGGETILFSDRPDTAAESEIRKPSFWLALQFHSHPHVSARSLFAIPAPISHSLPIRSERRRTNGGRSLWQGRRTRSIPGAKRRPASVESGRSISRRGRSIFRREVAASLLFPRLGEINSRRLRVFADTG